MFKSILRLLGTILIAVAFAFVLIMCVGERTKVSGHSMEPHLHDHDQVLLDKLTYRFRDPKRYEISIRCSFLITNSMNQPVHLS